MMFRRAVLLLLFVTLGLAAGLVLTGRMRTAGETVAATSQPGAVARGGAPAPQAAPPIAGGMPDLTVVAERAIGSVTNISSTQVVRTPNSPFANDPFFRFFFDDRNDAFGYRERRAQSLGSGVVVSADGYVLTNNHVVAQGVEVSVTMPDKRELRAEVVGVDEATDIAVLKVKADRLPVMPWGDSSKLRVAEWVLAIGNPFQLNQTVTLGIVSATGRRLEGRLASYEDFIQTDAAINPGNSGGALVNARGELVGINTAIFSETGGYQGIGFAVPSNLARHVMDDLIKYGMVQRGTIPGITVQSLTTMIAEQLGAADTRGALVVGMQQRSDAYAAGIRPGDIIVSFNGSPVDDASHFERQLSDAKIGSTVTLSLLRERRQLSVKVPIVKASIQRRRG
ncbi:MAG: trypsin-like peptidase domain-containing protein [Acidobacteriota bacterium]|nr:trypsin-like peptidase domain-containing protein [Acidobacteriota bacterium]